MFSLPLSRFPRGTSAGHFRGVCVPFAGHRKSTPWDDPTGCFALCSCQTAGGIVDVRQAAGDGFAVNADFTGRVQLREPAHDIKLHDLLIDHVQKSLVGDALPVAAREVFQLLRQSQPRSYLLSLPSARCPGRFYLMAAASFFRRSSPYL